MRFLPFEDFEIRSSLSSSEIFYRLRAAVDAQRKWWIFTNKPFWGEANRHYFRIWRATWWLGNVTPVVSGNIASEGSECYVRIRMRMPWPALLFSSIWLGALWYMYFRGMAFLVIQRVQTGIWQIASPWLLLPGIGMFAFGYLLFVGSFKWEAKRVKEFLLDLSGSKEESVVYRDRLFGLTESQIISSLLMVTLAAVLAWIVFRLFW